MSDTGRVVEILKRVIPLAQEYQQATGRPLGITGEVGEALAAHLLDLELSPVRTKGYDAVSNDGQVRYQVKTRRLGPHRGGGRISQIRHSDQFDAVLLVLLDEDYQPTAIWEAARPALLAALDRPGSISRNVRRALGISQFTAIARRVWPR